MRDDLLVDLVTGVGRYHGVENFDSGEYLRAAVKAAARELRLPGHLAMGDRTPPNVYPDHAAVMRVFGVVMLRHGLVLPDGAACEHCARARVPGRSVCQIHLLSLGVGDAEADEALMAELAAGEVPGDG